MPRNELRALGLPIVEALGKRAAGRVRMRPLDCEAYSVGGVVPKLVFSPRTAAEASETVATIAAQGATIVIRGAATKQFRPPPSLDVDVVLDTTHCTGIVAHTPADLTVTVAAGTPLVQLQDALRAHNQFFPADPPFANQTTIGGMLSGRSIGALRQHYGAPRDSVLGMRVVLSDGSSPFTGSKVVKSVAGYDIPKLFVGAWGTLGFIAEVTLKVAPLPREQRGVMASFPSCDQACDAALRLAASASAPLATTLHDRASAQRIRAAVGGQYNGWMLVLRCGGTRGALVRQVDAIARACTSCGALAVDVVDADRLLFAWSDISELAGGAAYPASHFLSLKLVSVPSDLPTMRSVVSQLFEAAELTAHPSHGVLHVHVPNADSELAKLDALLQRCRDERWTATLLAAAPALASQLHQPVAFDTPIALMRKVKAALDPTGTFDPGRLLGGI